MKGKMKKVLCGLLASVMLLSVPTVAQAMTLRIDGVDTGIQMKYDSGPLFKMNTKAKTITVYAGLEYYIKAKGFADAKATWKVSNKKYATVKGNKYGSVAMTPKKAGKFTLTAKQGKKKYTYKVTVKNDLSKRYVGRTQKGTKLTWKKVPGVTGYKVYRQYFPESSVTENGWVADEIITLADLKGDNHTSYTIKEENWQSLRNANWIYKVKAYKKVGEKVTFSAEYPESIAFENHIVLK